ncbi:DEAD/DEAH box helicase family protein [Sphingomonas sediminicola]|uniref:DEAD/DEAH box helicase family protein n=1 Tax=Sphingomonas sediminicola TaxID=386874 RepID=A0ABX6T742_9SPHN|nr:DEAD/DEAH box helicase family protein [Sphingomonas sediminicola]QNP45677.1 DEAD/DEAH box helicase family protein [Sphingomonas sediminicola]
MEFPEALNLWAHQAAAVGTIDAYLNRRRTAAALGRAALINVPTGGGKTAIIGVSAHWHPRAERVLVLAPRTAIRDQLARELGGQRGFFPRHGFDAAVLPKAVKCVSTAADLAELPDRGILVSTIQLIDDLTRSQEKRVTYDRLADWCDAIFVDEGHYEPARSWSQTIRGLKTQTVLVTATPYRNDLKLFELDSEALHVTRYEELVAANILRRVAVVEGDPAALATQEGFVQSVYDIFVEQFGEPPSTQRKLIIRCDGEDTVRQIGNVVRHHALGAAGIVCLHERFSPAFSEPWEVRQPPDPEADNAPAVWVHQHKLLEGVDGPSFQAVAFFDVRGSARALVQQIGRVIRNPARVPEATALLIDHSNDFLASSWRRYLRYDSTLTKAGILRGLDEIAGQLDRTLPDILYVDRQFRERFVHGPGSEAELLASLRLPQRCQLWRASAGFSMAALRAASERRFVDASYPYTLLEESEDALTILFTSVDSSPLLQDHYFLERTLHVLVCQRVGDTIVFLDTSRPNPDPDARAHMHGAVPRSRMVGLLTQGVDSNIIEVGARNSALGPSAVRRRLTTAAALQATPPLLDEFQYVASTVTAARASAGPPVVAGGFVRRAIGFSRGGVADAGPRLSLTEWSGWTRALLAVIAGQQAGPTYLDRFAAPLDAPPADPRPRSLLFDLDDIGAHYESAQGQGIPHSQPVEIADLCLECHADQAEAAGDLEARRLVQIDANNVACPGTVRYVASSGTYELESPRLAQLYRRTDATRSGSIVDVLNARQAFTVITESPNTVYADSNFYDPRLPLGPGFDFAAIGLGNVFLHEPALRARTSEKGGQNSALPAGWAPNSVFEWIDTNVGAIADAPELVVCDDGTREFCDFIIVGTRSGRPLVQMVHAKAADGAWVSASKLHDVCGQASKQVGMLSLFAPARPRQVDLWSEAWVGPGGEGTVNARTRHANGAWAGLAGPEIWTRLDRLLRQQDTEREVVLVLGACLNRDHLLNGASAVPATVNATHALQLLRSTMAAVAGVGARLRVICG